LHARVALDDLDAALHELAVVGVLRSRCVHPRIAL